MDPFYFNNSFGISYSLNIDFVEATYFKIGGRKFFAAGKFSKQIIGFQFHPELSGENGEKTFNDLIE